jgi:hypothetical protein
MVGFLPVVNTEMAVMLSSIMTGVISLPANFSHSWSAGSASCRMAKSAATISASGVEWLTQVCLFEIPCRVTKVWAALTQRKTPDVLRLVSRSPAKSASL